MSNYSFFALLARMKYINRWGLMRNTEREDIAQHSLQVSIIAHALATIARDIYGKDVNPDKAAVLGLYHDTSEILTGDLPTPVKYFNSDIAKAYKSIEKTTVDKMLKLLPEELIPSYREVYDGLEGELKEIVKAADKISAYIKCIEECSAGNADFKKAYEATKSIVYKIELPEVKYFLEKFIESYRLTIDEI